MGARAVWSGRLDEVEVVLNLAVVVPSHSLAAVAVTTGINFVTVHFLLRAYTNAATVLSHAVPVLTLAGFRIPENVATVIAGGEDVVDYGTGSGVLAAAAAVLGAERVVALDIDVEILVHARQNFLVRFLVDTSLVLWSLSVVNMVGVRGARCVHVRGA